LVFAFTIATHLQSLHFGFFAMFALAGH